MVFWSGWECRVKPLFHSYGCQILNPSCLVINFLKFYSDPRMHSYSIIFKFGIHCLGKFSCRNFPIHVCLAISKNVLASASQSRIH